MIRNVLTVAVIVCLAGCHFEAGFGNRMPEVNLTENYRDINTVNQPDGSSVTTEIVTQKTCYDDGSSKAVSTTTQTTRDTEGHESQSSTTTTTNTTANGSTTTSSTSQG